MTVTALADRLNIDRTNVSRLCARMEALGEVERMLHPADARARLVKLSRRGERLARSVDHSSAEHFARVLGELDRDAGGVVEAIEALTRAMTVPATEEDCA
jgi:DNA-binding MarR family transcriptional regulator